LRCAHYTFFYIKQVYSGDVGDLFDIAEARAALQRRREELIAECKACHQIQGKFDLINAHLNTAHAIYAREGETDDVGSSFQDIIETTDYLDELDTGAYTSDEDELSVSGSVSGSYRDPLSNRERDDDSNFSSLNLDDNSSTSSSLQYTTGSKSSSKSGGGRRAATAAAAAPSRRQQRQQDFLDSDDDDFIVNSMSFPELDDFDAFSFEEANQQAQQQQQQLHQQRQARQQPATATTTSATAAAAAKPAVRRSAKAVP
jgi:hypothetical protein